MQDILDFVIVGSGFGGSVSALRLTEKGYRVRVLERGKRFRDEDFARTNWNVRKALWAPALRCFGILQISPFRDVFVLHGPPRHGSLVEDRRVSEGFDTRWGA